jgi:hypothetical protein
MMSWPVVNAALGELSQSTALAISDYGELAGDVNRRAGKADVPGGGGVIDDGTTPGTKHGRDFMLHREQQATDVDVADLMVMLDRPHSALGYRTPSEYAGSRTNRFDGGCAPPNPAPLAAAGVRGELSNATRWQTKKQN